MKTTIVAVFILLAISHQAVAGVLTSLGGSRISAAHDLTVAQRQDTDGYYKIDIYGLDASGAMATGIMTEETQAFSGMSFVAYGTVQSNMSAVGWQRHREVFAMKNNLIYHTTSDDNSNWTNWQLVPSQIDYICSAPSAVSWSPGRIDVFVMGCDYGSNVGALKHGFTSGGNVWSWEDRGGVIYSAPSAISTAVGELDVFATGGSNIVWDDSWRNGWTWLQTPLTASYPPVGVVNRFWGPSNYRPEVLAHNYATNQIGVTNDEGDGGPYSIWAPTSFGATVSANSVPHASVNIAEVYSYPDVYMYYLVNNVIKRQGYNFGAGWSQPSNNFDNDVVLGNPIPLVPQVGLTTPIFVFTVKSDGNIYYGLDEYL